MKEYSYNIDNVFNIFSSYPLDEILSKYHIKDYYYLNQIHSNKVLILDDNYLNNTDGDGLITDEINKAVIVRTADCIPIIIYDRENKVLSVVHSGWKGTLNNIVSSALDIMIDKYKSNIANISVYMYPSIRKCHFEVEEDVYRLFKDKVNSEYITNKGIKYYIDLQSIIKDNLISYGIKDIHDSNICTYCNHDKYYSYRYNKTDKRNYLIAYIKEGL